jgi:hypothetical protein
MAIATAASLWESRMTSERRRIETSGRMRESETPRKAPRRGGAGEDVLRLQRAVGNAAVGRILARFAEPEHKAIGDQALRHRRWRLPGGVWKDFELTFGDWVALGDWFENIAEIKEMIRGTPGHTTSTATLGQLYYALFVMIRPKTSDERHKVEKQYMGDLFTQDDKKRVLDRYAELKSRNISHFPNPLKGDWQLTTAGKARRHDKDFRPLGAIARYHSDHLEAIEVARKGGEINEDRILGEALAMDGFACHFLTDAFSGSHARTPRASIKEYWDAKEPRFPDKLVNFLADEATFAIASDPSGATQWIGAALDQLTFQSLHLVRDAARKQIGKDVPKVTFGDLVGLIVHDWEGERGPLVEVAGQRLRLPGDDLLLPVVAGLEKVTSDARLMALLKSKPKKTDDPKKFDAERAFAGATLAVRASVSDIEAAFKLGQKGKQREQVIAALIGKDKLFASERLIPTLVPEASQPEDDRIPKWNYETADKLLADPKISSALPLSAQKIGEPFGETIDDLPVSKAIKNQLKRAVVAPLCSKDLKRVLALLHDVLHYSPDRVTRRIDSVSANRRDLVELKQGVR